MSSGWSRFRVHQETLNNFNLTHQTAKGFVVVKRSPASLPSLKGRSPRTHKIEQKKNLSSYRSRTFRTIPQLRPEEHGLQPGSGVATAGAKHTYLCTEGAWGWRGSPRAQSTGILRRSNGSNNFHCLVVCRFGRLFIWLVGKTMPWESDMNLNVRRRNGT